MTTTNPASVAALRPTEIAHIQKIVRESTRLLPVGGRTKPALFAAAAATTLLDLSQYSGVIEYEPTEFTITARAGTRLADLQAALAAHGQYLPFHPPFVAQGATLGGAVASGLNGPGRLRYGGLRDFILGVRLVDGLGDDVRGGGKVVKNAAGFDLPKLMVGSLGRLGVLTEITLKVFPAPEHRLTLRATYPDLPAAVAGLCRLTSQCFDLDALDLEPPGTLWIRLAGSPQGVATHAERVRQFIGHSCEVWSDSGAAGGAGTSAHDYWQAMDDFSWRPAGAALVKVPLTPQRIVPLDAAVAPLGVKRRYSVAGNLAWLACPTEVPGADLRQALAALGLAGSQILGNVDPTLGGHVGVSHPDVFAARIKHALDPHGRMGDLP